LLIDHYLSQQREREGEARYKTDTGKEEEHEEGDEMKKKGLKERFP